MRLTCLKGLPRAIGVRSYSDLGSGAGRGGGGGGSIREAGGAMGRLEAAREEQYFHEKTREQLKELKKHFHKEIKFHEEQIERHEAAIKRSKEQVTSLDKKPK